MLFVVLAACTALLIFVFQKQKCTPRLPKGPRGVPLFGNLMQLGSTPHLQLSKWAQQYGKYYVVNLASKPALVVNDEKMIKELFGMMAAAGRIKTEVAQLMGEGTYGVLNSEGKPWVEQRNFCMRGLKEFGFGRGFQMEPIIMREVDELCSYIDSSSPCQGKNERKLCINHKMVPLTTNIVWTLVSGERLRYHESPLVHLMQEFVRCMAIASKSGILFFSWIKYLAPVQSGYTGLKIVLHDIHKYVRGCFQEHKNTRNKGEPPRDLIDMLIESVESCKDPQSSFYGEEGWTHSYNSCFAFLLGGGEAPGITVNWMIYYLCVWPNVQRKLQEEIDRVVGKSRNPCLADKLNMPYMEAVIMETLRMSSIAPLGIMHEVMEDLEFQGYQLPKGLLLIANLYYCHHDKSVWGDPENFRPERFFERGGSLKEYLVPFSPGKRVCPGEPLAKDVIFLFATKLFQMYTFSVDPDVKDINAYLEFTFSLEVIPKNNLNIVAKSRLVEAI